MIQVGDYVRIINDDFVCSNQLKYYSNNSIVKVIEKFHQFYSVQADPQGIFIPSSVLLTQDDLEKI